MRGPSTDSRRALQARAGRKPHPSGKVPRAMGTGSAPRHGLSPFLPLDVGETRGWLQGAGPAPRELVGTGLRLSLVPFDETALRGLREPGHSPGLRALPARPPPTLVHVVTCPPFQVGQAAAAWCGRLSFLSPLFGRLSPPIGLAGHTLSCPLPTQCTWAGLPWADLLVRRRCPEGPGGLRIWPASP